MTSLPLHDPVHIFALVMLIILAVPIGCRLARVPSAFGLIVAGVLLGPHALAILERDATMRLFGRHRSVSARPRAAAAPAGRGDARGSGCSPRLNCGGTPTCTEA